MRRFISVSFLLIAVVSTQIQAAPLEWTLNDVVFEDGTTATGSFFYDADTNEFSSIAINSNILYGESSAFPTNIIAAGPAQLGLEVEAIGLPGITPFVNIFALEITLAGDMTGRGGTIPILIGDGSVERRPFVFPPTRSIVSGSVSAVPIPAAVWLFGSALAGLGWLSRLKQQLQQI